MKLNTVHKASFRSGLNVKDCILTILVLLPD